MMYINPNLEQNSPHIFEPNTHVNTSAPHPAMAVNILGPRSLAGFMA